MLFTCYCICMRKNIRTAFNPRQYMLSEDYEIFYYSDAEFRSVGMHSHDYYEFYLYEEGSVTMDIEDTSYPLRTGDLVLVPPGSEHRARVFSSEKPYRRFVFWISVPYCEMLTKDSPDCTWLIRHTETEKTYIYHFSETDFHSVQAKMVRILEEISSRRFGRDTYLRIAVNDLLLDLSRRVYETLNTGYTDSERDTFSALLAYIDQHLSDDLRLEQLAAKFFLSKFYIAHTFKDRLGLSVHRYIQKKRLDAVRNAVMNGESVSDACREYGFTDYSVFYRAFRKEYGMSPSEYRTIASRSE